MKHPRWNDWIDWVEGRGDEAQRDRLREHLEDCAPCGRDVATLRRLQDAGAVGPLATPPDSLLEEILEQTREQPAPPPPSGAEAVEWELTDIRGAEAKAAGEALYLARSLPGYQLSLMVDPPGPDRMWTIEGRLWPEDEAATPPIRVLLLHDDHVLVDETASIGEPFRLREVADAGWRLELHLGSQRAFVIDDPFV